MSKFPGSREQAVTLGDESVEFIPKRDTTLSDADVELIAPLDKRETTLSDADVEFIPNRPETLHDGDISFLDSDEK